MAAASPTVTTSPPLPTVAAPRVPATIVPLAGLPFVAGALAFVIIAIAGNWLWALNFCHVVGGGIWTALDLFLGFVLGPIIGRLSIPSRAEFVSRLMPAMLLIMPTVVTITLTSGFQLARYLGFLSTAYPRHAWVVASFVLVGIMAVIAIGILEPANLAILFELRKPEPNGLLIASLTRRFLYTAGITGLLQVGTLIIMTRIAT